MFEETKFFKIGKYSFQFCVEDPIFFRSAQIPQNQRENNSICESCKQKI